MGKNKYFGYEELNDNFTDEELIKLYNRVAERINKRITRAQQQGLNIKLAGVDISRQKTLRSEKAKQAALSNRAHLQSEIVRLENMAEKPFTASALRQQPQRIAQFVKQATYFSYQGRNYDNAMRSGWYKLQNLTEEQLEQVAELADKLGVKYSDDDNQMWYEIQRRITYHGGSTPVIRSFDDLMRVGNEAVRAGASPIFDEDNPIESFRVWGNRGGFDER